MHHPYCWQVGLHQSLLPLQDDKCILRIKTEEITNHFSVHYHPTKSRSGGEPINEVRNSSRRMDRIPIRTRDCLGF
jgi:hypothetical protein